MRPQGRRLPTTHAASRMPRQLAQRLRFPATVSAIVAAAELCLQQKEGSAAAASAERLVCCGATTVPLTFVVPLCVRLTTHRGSRAERLLCLDVVRRMDARAGEMAALLLLEDNASSSAVGGGGEAPAEVLGDGDASMLAAQPSALDLRVLHPSRWYATVVDVTLDAAENGKAPAFRIPMQAAVDVIATSPAFNDPALFSTAHTALVRLLAGHLAHAVDAARRGVEHPKAEPLSPHQRAPLVAAASLRGLRTVYLRALRIPEYCDLFDAVFTAQCAVDSVQGRWPSSLDPELLEFYAVMPARRECAMAKTDQWRRVLRHTQQVLQLLASPETLLRLVSNVALFLTPVGACARVHELLLLICDIAAEGGPSDDAQLARILREALSAITAATLNRVQTSRLSGIDETLAVLTCTAGVRGCLPAASSAAGSAASAGVSTGVLRSLVLEQLSRESRAEGSDNALTSTTSGASQSCVDYVEGVGVQLLASIAAKVDDEDRRRLLGRDVLRWCDLNLRRVPAPAPHTLTGLCLPRVAKLLQGGAFHSVQAAAATTFTWQCGCGATNTAAATVCVRCFTRSLGADGGPRYSQCMACGKQRVEPHINEPCRGCGAPHPFADQLRLRSLWRCSACARLCAAREECRGCGARDPDEVIPCASCAAPVKRGASTCDVCGVARHPMAMHFCYACDCVVAASRTDSDAGARPCAGREVCGASDFAAQCDLSPPLPYVQWTCGCGALNSPLATACRVCERKTAASFTCPHCSRRDVPRQATQTPPPTRSRPPAATAAAAAAPSPWVATCCRGCGELHPRDAALTAAGEGTPASGLCLRVPQPAGSGPSQEQLHQQLFLLVGGGAAAPWQCHQCGQRNAPLGRNAASISCLHCGADRISTVLLDPLRRWQCQDCGAHSRGFSCGRCSALHPAVPRESVFVWECERCYMNNASWETRCRRDGCGGWNPGASPKGRRNRRFVYIPWRCGECGAPNRALNVRCCHRCQAARPRPHCSICGGTHLAHACPPSAQDERQRRVEAALLECYNDPSPTIDELLQPFAAAAAAGGGGDPLPALTLEGHAWLPQSLQLPPF